MPRFNALFAIFPGIILVLASALLISGASEDSAVPDTGNTEKSVAGPLDGMTFKGAVGPDGKLKDIADVFVFENGTFVSKECEFRCKYPASPYFVRVDGDKTEFISEARCPYKDARIIWRGTIEGDRIIGKSTWFINRWYWSIEDSFEFEGKLVDNRSSSANIE